MQLGLGTPNGRREWCQNTELPKISRKRSLAYPIKRSIGLITELSSMTLRYSTTCPKTCIRTYIRAFVTHNPQTSDAHLICTPSINDLESPSQNRSACNILQTALLHHCLLRISVTLILPRKWLNATFLAATASRTLV